MKNGKKLLLLLLVLVVLVALAFGIVMETMAIQERQDKEARTVKMV